MCGNSSDSPPASPEDLEKEEEKLRQSLAKLEKEERPTPRDSYEGPYGAPGVPECF